MTSILQSGNVTPGHLATWTADGVLQDGGAAIALQTVLGTLHSADFNSTADQIIQIPTSFAAFSITGIIVTNANLSLSVAAGGIYPAAAKGGTAIVAASQVYSSLTAATKLLNATIEAAALATRWSGTNLTTPFAGNYALYLSLTTAQGAAAIADVYVIGVPLS